MHINCPECGFQFDLSSDLIGVHVRCSNCNTKFQVSGGGKIEVIEEAFSEGSQKEIAGEVISGRRIEPLGDDLPSMQMPSFQDALSKAKNSAVEAYIFLGAAAVLVVCVIFMVGLLIFRTDINFYYARKNKVTDESTDIMLCRKNLAYTGALFRQHAENYGDLPSEKLYKKRISKTEIPWGYKCYCLQYGLYEVKLDGVSPDT
ncbi:MAG: zinc-ribbon domain-containing protein, partial [Lentisphaeria bacterium]|nr:zinc-ribbon domain-containing protein [Lentisphaeria bacterium]